MYETFCQNCGQSILADASAAATHCPYCQAPADAPVIVQGPARRNKKSKPLLDGQSKAIIAIAAVLCLMAIVGGLVAGRRAGYSHLTRPAQAREWFEGGTLHDKTIGEWRAARYENRLATSADIVVSVGKYRTLPPDLKRRATEMEIAISTAADDGGIDHMSVAEIAAGCAVLMGY